MDVHELAKDSHCVRVGHRFAFVIVGSVAVMMIVCQWEKLFCCALKLSTVVALNLGPAVVAWTSGGKEQRRSKLTCGSRVLPNKAVCVFTTSCHDSGSDPSTWEKVKCFADQVHQIEQKSWMWLLQHLLHPSARQCAGMWESVQFRFRLLSTWAARTNHKVLFTKWSERESPCQWGKKSQEDCFQMRLGQWPGNKRCRNDLQLNDEDFTVGRCVHPQWWCLWSSHFKVQQNQWQQLHNHHF